MPKKMTDKDRILAFAFRASVEDLNEAKAVIDAALRAKRGGPTRKPTTRKGGRDVAQKDKVADGVDNPTE